MLREDGKRSRSHGLPVSLIQKQALALDIPLVVRATSWDNYEETFISATREFKKEGIESGIFGDIDLEPHREWVERVCSSVNIHPYEPLWKKKRRDLLKELFEIGFKAVIVSVIKEDTLDKKFLGKTLDANLVREIKKSGIDASGEEGEYHTVITNGPIFSSPIHIEIKGQILRSGYWFLNILPVNID
jgi:uncharacterized protein (TIGR00290 family)